MKSFFKIFFASFLALVVFTIISMLIIFGVIGSMISGSKPEIGNKSVLVLDLNQTYHEQQSEDLLSLLEKNSLNPVPGVFDVVRMIDYASSDSAIKILYIKASQNPNGFGTSEELRNAVLRFKKSGKMVIAYGETIDQKSYYVASAADKIYCHPEGGLDWRGLAVNTIFFKGLLDKLEIEPQVFYAGKFKSATEPFRVQKMTEPNRLQTTDLLNDIYANFLLGVSQSRKLDTATLHNLAVEGTIQTAHDAMTAGLIDGTWYDDQVKTDLLKRLDMKETDKLRFVSMEDYGQAREYRTFKGDKMAIIYAEGNIIDGRMDKGQIIASENYISLIRKIRLDKNIKAVVLRVNSPGGSALASDGIWREITLLKKEKPVVVSMGDLAASGGYYISCAADSIFAEPGTLTGSIGVFGIVANMQKLFNQKLGITFDGVKTAPYADMGNISRPLTAPEQRLIQSSIDTIYHVFKSRVSEGRKLDVEYVDSIAQGHVYTGQRALEIKLVDRIGYLGDAVEAAAKMADLKTYWVKEYPERKTFFQQLMSSSPAATVRENALKKSLGEKEYKYLQQIQELQQLTNGTQARLLAVPEIY